MRILLIFQSSPTEIIIENDSTSDIFCKRDCVVIISDLEENCLSKRSYIIILVYVISRSDTV